MQLSQKARKALAAGLAISTLVWAGVGIIPTTASAAVHTEGCLVLSGGVVWMITNGTRRGFTSAEVFQSWGYNFSQVVTATAEDVALPVGPIMTYADGTLVKGPSDPLVYLVAGGQKRPFVSGEVFLGLGYSFANVQQAPSNTFADLPTGANMDSTTMAHPDGTKVISNGAIWEMTANGRMGFPSAANFLSYGYKFEHVVAANAADLALPDQGVVPARPACSTSGQDNNGPMSVSLSGPSASVLVMGQAQAELANFVFTGNGTVTSATFERIGVSGDDVLTNVYLFDGATRLTDGASITSGSKVTFANPNLFTVNGSKTISVKGDIKGTDVSGQLVGMRLVSYTVGGSANTVSVSGNIHTIASASLATAGFTTNVATHAGDTDPISDVTVWQATLNVQVRDVTMTRLALHQMGSIQSSDIRNFKLYVDGVQVASTYSLDSEGYVTFATNKVLQTGNRVMRVTADIVGGSGRTYRLSLDGAYDISVRDSQYNVNSLVTVDGGTNAFPVRPAAVGNINAGATTTVKTSDSPTGNVVLGASDQVLGRWTITATGEPVKINQLQVNAVAADDDGFRNGRLLINGTQYGSTTNLATDTTGNGGADTTFTVNYTVNPGSPITVEVRADMVMSNGGAYTDADPVKVTLKKMGAENATTQTSITSVFVPTADVPANDLTISSGDLSLVVNSNYASRNVVVPQTAYKLASFNLSNGNTEDININTFTVTYTPGDGNDGGATNEFTAADLTNLYIVYGGNTTSIKPTANGAGDSFSVSYTMPKNVVVPVEIYGNIGTDVSANDTLKLSLAITAVAASSNATADVNATDGQTLTAKTGGSISAVLSGTSPVARNVYDNQTVTAGAFEFTAVDEDFNITDVRVVLASTSAVTSVILKDGSTVLGSRPAALNVDFNGLNVMVGANESKVLTVDLQLGQVGTGSGSTGSAVTVSLPNTSANVKATGSASGVTQVTIAGVSAEAHYAFAAVPTLTKADTATGLLSGTRDLAKFTVSSDGGTIGWKKFTVSVTGKIGGDTIGCDDDGTPSCSTTVIQAITAGVDDDDVTAIDGLTLVDENNSTVAGTFTVANTTGAVVSFVADNEQQVASSKTYTLKGNVAGGLTTGDNVVVSFVPNGTVHLNSDTYANIAAADANGGTAGTPVSTFVWTDRSAVPHSATSADWNNEFLVKNLPLNTWAYNYSN